MPDEDVIDDGGLEPADEQTALDVLEESEAPAPEPEPETYTREQLAELLGPRFERFATHEGPEAFRQFGSAYENATGLIRQGAHLEPQDPSIYDSVGIDPNEVELPPQEEAPGLFGVPWGEPQTWDEVEAMAASEYPQHKQAAAMAVVRAPDAPEEYKRAYWDNAYGQGSYDSLRIQQQVESEQRAGLREELKAEILAEIGPIYQDFTDRSVDNIIATARTSIDGFKDYEPQIAALMQERERRFPGYQENFNHGSSMEQLAEFAELTLIAASRAVPAQQAAAQASVEATDASKQRARTETSRTNGAPSDAAALKQQSLDEARRVFGNVR